MEARQRQSPLFPVALQPLNQMKRSVPKTGRSRLGVWPLNDLFLMFS
jgi:hypothetical protein